MERRLVKNLTFYYLGSFWFGVIGLLTIFSATRANTAINNGNPYLFGKAVYFGADRPVGMATLGWIVCGFGLPVDLRSKYTAFGGGNLLRNRG